MAKTRIQIYLNDGELEILSRVNSIIKKERPQDAIHDLISTKAKEFDAVDSKRYKPSEGLAKKREAMDFLNSLHKMQEDEITDYLIKIDYFRPPYSYYPENKSTPWHRDVIRKDSASGEFHMWDEEFFPDKPLEVVHRNQGYSLDEIIADIKKRKII